MEIRPIVIGTAGHIDHGKSTLVRALTGIDPDRLKEERQRGLTIDLGFAPLETPDGQRVGLVDVPGHERFIRNMVAGATGIDLVVLVVAADDGVMPQTREHLQIMQLLGVESGLVALTKIDAVDEELVELAEEDVRSEVRGTFLAEAPILRISALEGLGLDAFRAALFDLVSRVQPRSDEGIFRMPIQRVFTKRGFGTVVTGIPVSGSARVGDVLEVLPGGQRSKVRGLNAYMEKEELVRAGHSSAINFSDVDHKSVVRGHVVATPNFFSPQRMVAARFQALEGNDRPVTNRMPIRLHTGTADPPGEIVILDREDVPPGASALVQLRLQEPIVCAPGDRFVLRLLSPVTTLGGGIILEESRHRLKRFRGFVIEELGRQEASLDSPGDLVESVLLRHGEVLVSLDELTQETKRDRAETSALLEELVQEGRVLRPRPDRWIHVDRFESVVRRLRREVDSWFEANAHRGIMEVLELRTRLGLDPALVTVLLEEEERRGALELLPGGKLRPAGREQALDPRLASLVEDLAGRLVAGRFQPPTPAELGGAVGASAKDVAQALESLVDAGRAVHVGGDAYYAAEVVEEARREVVANCEAHGHLEIPALRDRLGTTRKYLIPLLEYFDVQGVTLRQAGHRVLRRR